MARSVFTDRTAKTHIFSGYLACHPKQGVKYSVGEPNLGAGWRWMKLKVHLPFSLFTTPSLAINIKVPNERTDPIDIDVVAAQEALEGVLGCRVEVTTNDDA